MLTGNGTIGSMVFGDPLNEKIIFNHEKLFLPIWFQYPVPKLSNIMPEVKKLIEEGMGNKARDLVFDEYMKQVDKIEDVDKDINIVWTDPYHPAFELNINMKNEYEISDYSREVDFETGEVIVNFRTKKGKICRRIFVSRADNIAVMEISSDHPMLLNLKCEITDINEQNVNLESKELTGEEFVDKALQTPENHDLSMYEKAFDAARYNILSSCGQFPPNLQGVWGGTYAPDWSGDYTMDANIQAAIAHLMPCNMLECMESYFNFIESYLDDWRQNAKNIYGIKVFLPLYDHLLMDGIFTLAKRFLDYFGRQGQDGYCHIIMIIICLQGIKNSLKKERIH